MPLGVIRIEQQDQTPAACSSPCEFGLPGNNDLIELRMLGPKPAVQSFQNARSESALNGIETIWGILRVW